MVKAVAIGFVFISMLFFLGTIHYLLAYTRPGVFPPKFIIKKRIIALAGSGGAFLIMALIFFYFI